MNNKGFTLVELLATISLLAVLMMIAVPNIIGVVNRNKNKTYVEDAKKLVALAEYKVRSDPANKPTNGKYFCFSMETLGEAEFDTTAPNGGKYDADKSYVKVTKGEDNALQYSVVLAEDKDGKFIGILNETLADNLYKDNDIVSLITSGNVSECSGVKK